MAQATSCSLPSRGEPSGRAKLEEAPDESPHPLPRRCRELLQGETGTREVPGAWASPGVTGTLWWSLQESEEGVGQWLQQTNNVSNVSFDLPSAPLCLELKGGC